MSSPLIKEFEDAQLKEEVPTINAGDTVEVAKLIIEGDKRRVQKFEGVVVKVTGASSRLSFTVRKVVDRVGVEKTFLLHSNQVEGVKVLKRGKVRRARLNYLRNRVGVKATRVKTKT